MSDYAPNDVSATVNLRRNPRQDRSAQRIEAILDAAAVLIDEIGYSSLSPTLIAKRVGMSGPGIYRYFDGVPAIAGALAARNLNRFMDAARSVLECRDAPWQQLLGRVIGVYCDFCRTEPGFRWLRLGDSIDRHLLSGTDSNLTVVAREVAELFVRRFEVDPRPRLEKHVEVVVEIVDTLTARAFEIHPEGDQFFIDEAKSVAAGYLTSYLARVSPLAAAV